MVHLELGTLPSVLKLLSIPYWKSSPIFHPHDMEIRAHFLAVRQSPKKDIHLHHAPMSIAHVPSFEIAHKTLSLLDNVLKLGHINKTNIASQSYLFGTMSTQTTTSFSVKLIPANNFLMSSEWQGIPFLRHKKKRWAKEIKDNTRKQNQLSNAATDLKVASR